MPRRLRGRRDLEAEPGTARRTLVDDLGLCGVEPLRWWRWRIGKRAEHPSHDEDEAQSDRESHEATDHEARRMCPFGQPRYREQKQLRGREDPNEDENPAGCPDG